MLFVENIASHRPNYLFNNLLAINRSLCREGFVTKSCPSMGISLVLGIVLARS